MSGKSGLQVLPEAPFVFDFDPAYTAAGWAAGIAWRVTGFETVSSSATEWSGYEVATGNVVAHMVGDDCDFSFDPSDLTAIADEDFCGCCGQVGCAWGAA